MAGLVAKGTMLPMTIPIVTELPRVLEATTADTFIAGATPVVSEVGPRDRALDVFHHPYAYAAAGRIDTRALVAA